ncbi:DUF3592 domain-containing protein [Serinicoccus kebangsaanensis]|uniref:DUF3592 domain-containing protein n=1 Tax=Serinicoccus kebangsaanensis TaxID=2602069 RepID=UPI00124CA0A9|nr:DUF3592 domain-containing protein [Serinicoccus kebangsaanensis]
MDLFGDQRWIITAIVWIGALQAAWFALVLPEQRRRRWRDGRFTVAELRQVSRTSVGVDTQGKGIYQAHGTLHADGRDVPAESVDRLTGDRRDLVGTTIECSYDPDNPGLVDLGPRSAPVLASAKGLGLVVLLAGLMIWSAWPYLRPLLGG